MYTSDQFLENSKNYAGAAVTQESVAELKEVSRLSALNPEERRWIPRRYKFNSKLPEFDMFDRTDTAEFLHKSRVAVRKWIEVHYGYVTDNNYDFPDFIVGSTSPPLGFEVKATPNPTMPYIRNALTSTIHKAGKLLASGELSGFTLVILTDEEKIPMLMSPHLTLHINNIAPDVVAGFEVFDILIGSLEASAEIFSPLIRVDVANGHATFF